LGNFLLLFYWIYYIFLWLVPLLLVQCSWFSGWSFDGLSKFLHVPFTEHFLFFFFNFCFIFELWDSVLYFVLVYWSGLQLCFLFD
jgi:hypothetical protein